MLYSQCRYLHLNTLLPFSTKCENHNTNNKMQVGLLLRPATAEWYDGQRWPATRGLTNPQLILLTPGSTNSNSSLLSFDPAIRTLEDIILRDPDSGGMQFASFPHCNITPPCGNDDKFSFEERTLDGLDTVPHLSLHHTNKYARHPFTTVYGSEGLAPDTSTSMGCSDSL